MTCELGRICSKPSCVCTLRVRTVAAISFPGLSEVSFDLGVENMRTGHLRRDTVARHVLEEEGHGLLALFIPGHRSEHTIQLSDREGVVLD